MCVRSGWCQNWGFRGILRGRRLIHPLPLRVPKPIWLQKKKIGNNNEMLTIKTPPQLREVILSEMYHSYGQCTWLL